jgi:hypothetical protein
MKDKVFGELQDLLQGLHAPNRLWQGCVVLEVFNEPLRVSFETTDGLWVREFHYQAFEDFKQNQANYKSLALGDLLEYYQNIILPLWKGNDYFGVPEFAPDVQTPQELEALLRSPSLYLHPPRDGVSSLGLSFECTWDVEHGVGVLLREGKVVQAGLAEVAMYDF